MIARILKHLAGPERPIGERRPLDAEGLRALEASLGVALPPSLHAVLSLDARWLARSFDWLDDAGAIGARETAQLVGGHAGPFAAAYGPICGARGSQRA